MSGEARQEALLRMHRAAEAASQLAPVIICHAGPITYVDPDPDRRRREHIIGRVRVEAILVGFASRRPKNAALLRLAAVCCRRENAGLTEEDGSAADRIVAGWIQRLERVLPLLDRDGHVEVTLYANKGVCAGAR